MRVFAFTIIALTATAGTAAAQSSPKAAAEALYNAGRALIDSGDKSKYPEACDKFSASESLDPSPGGHLNLAHCLELIDKTASAWAAYKEASGLARAAGEANREALAVKSAAALEHELSKMRIVAEANQPNLEVRLDGLAIQPGMWSTDLPVDPGNHTIEAKAPGKVSFKTTIPVNPHGDRKTVTIPLLEAEPVAASSLAAAPPVAARPSVDVAPRPVDGEQATKPSIAPWIIGGVGVAALGAGAVLAVVVHGDHTTTTNECNATTLRCSPDGLSAANSGRTLGPISTVGFVVGGIGVGLAATWLIVRAPAKSKSAATTVGMGPAMTASGGGWRLQGSW